MTNTCMDCPAAITKAAQRCKTCAQKYIQANKTPEQKRTHTRRVNIVLHRETERLKVW